MIIKCSAAYLTRVSMFVSILLLPLVANAIEGPVTVFVAKNIITMEPSLPEATAVELQKEKLSQLVISSLWSPGLEAVR